MKRLLVIATGALVTVVALTSVVGSAAQLTVNGGNAQVFHFVMPPPEREDPPEQCAEILAMEGVTVSWGTSGDDDFTGGNQPQVYIGLDGDDVIRGGTQSDCLVGGAGADKIYGDNAKDVLLGGPGNDYLDGGASKDEIDGGDDSDTCDGGLGNDQLVNCEG